MDNTKELTTITTTQDNPVTIIENHVTLRTSDSEDFSKTNSIDNIQQKEQVESHGSEELEILNKDIVIQKFQDETTDYRANMTNINALPTNEIQTQNKDLLITNSAKEQEISSALLGTNNELLSSKQETIDLTVAQIKTQIHGLKQQVRFAARGEGKDIREVKRYIIDWLNLAEKRVNKYKRATKRFGTEVVKDSHEAAMYAKIATLLSNSKDYVSQAITGDINEAKKFFPPNVFEDGSAYIPDKSPSKEIYNKQVNPEWINKLSPAERKAYVQCIEGSGSKNSINKELSKVIDTKMGPWLDENVTNGKGTNVITGAAKLGLLVVNGVTLWNMGKNLFGMIFGKEGKTRGQLFQNFLVNAGIFTGLNFVDPDKAKAALGDTWAWISGKEIGDKTLYTKDGHVDFSSALTTIENQSSDESKKIVSATGIAAYGLAGLNYSEAAENNILQTDGQYVIGVNTENLIAFYNKKYSSDTKKRKEFIDYANTLAQVQQKNPQLLSKTMQTSGILSNNLQNPDYSNTIIGRTIMPDIKGTVEGILSNDIDNAVKKSQPDIVQQIGATEYNTLITTITKLPDNIQEEIKSGKIEFKANGEQLFMKAHGEVIMLNLKNNTFALPNKNGTFIEFTDSTQDTEELLTVSLLLTKGISQYKNLFNAKRPWLYSKGMTNAKEIYAKTGSAMIRYPNSRLGGQTVTLLDAFAIVGDNTKKFRHDDILERLTQYINDLDIWQGSSAPMTSSTQNPITTEQGTGARKTNAQQETQQDNNTTSTSPHTNIREQIGIKTVNIVKWVRDSGDQAGRDIVNGIKKGIQQ